MTESNLHFKYKEQIKYALIKAGWEEATNEAVRKVNTDGLHKYAFLDFRLDVFARKGEVSLGVEIDNPKSGGGHASGRERSKDRARTQAIKDQYGILVLRLEFYQIKGCTDDEIIAEINHEIKRYCPTFPGSSG